jgi:hypothetical protein
MSDLGTPSMISKHWPALLDTTLRTVNYFIPLGYLAEARYLIDRVAAVSLRPDILPLLDKIVVRSVRQKASQLPKDPLRRQVTYLDRPISVAQEPVRVGRLFRAAAHGFSLEPIHHVANVRSDVVNSVTQVAKNFAAVDQYPVALSIGMLAAVLDSAAHGNTDDLVDQVSKFVVPDVAQIVAMTDPLSMARDLHSHGQLAACAAVLTGTLRLGALQDPQMRDMWFAMDSTLPEITPIEVKADKTLHAIPEVTTTKIEERQINAWIEDAEGPLIYGIAYKLLINIGRRRSGALATAGLPPIDWGVQEEVPILVVVSGTDFVITPRLRHILLPKLGDTAPVEFAVTPKVVSKPILRISFYLEDDFSLLEEFEVPIEAQEAKKAA